MKCFGHLEHEKEKEKKKELSCKNKTNETENRFIRRRRGRKITYTH